MPYPLLCGRPAEADHAQLYEILVGELTDLAVFLMDPDGCIASWNPGVQRILGYTEAEWLGQSAEIIFTPEDRAQEKPKEERVTAEQKGRALDIRWHVRKNGERLFVDGTMVALRDEEGQLLGFSKVMRDITQRKRLEMALAEREQRYQALFTSIDEGFCLCEMIWDTAGHPVDYRFLECNPGFEVTTGVTRSRALSGTARAILPGLADHWAERYGRMMRTGKPERFESHSAVMSRWFNVYAQPVNDSQFLIIFSDVTARKIAEADREQLLQQIDTERNKLGRIFAQAPVSILVLRGRNFVIEEANPSYHALLPGKELIGRPFADVIPDLGQDVWDTFNRVLDTGEPFFAKEFYTPYDSDGDGVPEDHWFNVAYNPLRESDSTVVGLIAVLTDVTSQVLSRQEIERANRELEEFAYVASHDLQEPLRMVNIYTQRILQCLHGEDPNVDHYALFVRQGVTRMQTLIRDLLTFSRATHPDEIPVGRADLSLSLREALAMLKSQIEESGAVLIAPTLPIVRGDTSQMAQVFQNLLSNALKYRRLDVVSELQISVEAKGNQFTIAVRDNGIGFEPQYAQRIFGLFKRLHKDEYPGTGLGLAICQRIVERYGGQMWAEGRPGNGATFYFLLHGEGKEVASNSVSRG